MTFVLRKHSPHADRAAYREAVERWQNFLIGLQFDEVAVPEGVKSLTADGTFGDITHLATAAFQRRFGLLADGKVGNRTYGRAMGLGFDLFDDDTPPEVRLDNPNWPARPRAPSPPDAAARIAFLGRIEFVAAPRPGNREGIRITSNWAADNIVRVAMPQLIGVCGAPPDGWVYFHRNVAPRAISLFDAWQRDGLMDKVLTWAGSWVPRFVRGSRTVLSNHAFGSAFDINVAWNYLGQRPELAGRKGNVRELVPLANEHGFFWGGHFRNRPDGMHFEFADF
jgi:hypothetical protein